MACNKQPTACAPCNDCPPSEPTQPRCDIVLDDGTFTNATVVVENGCIVSVQGGTPMVYRPDICCDAPQSPGGGDEPCDCPPGDPGENATVSIAQVFTVEYGEQARAENIGTPSNVILNLYIPQGRPGQDSDSVSGVTDERGGIVIENGVIKLLPATWPPVLFVQGETDNQQVSLTFSAPDTGTGMVKATLNLQPLINSMNFERQQSEQNLQNQINQLQQQISQQQTQINNILNTCCGPNP